MFPKVGTDGRLPRFPDALNTTFKCRTAVYLAIEPAQPDTEIIGLITSCAIGENGTGIVGGEVGEEEIQGVASRRVAGEVEAVRRQPAAHRLVETDVHRTRERINPVRLEQLSNGVTGVDIVLSAGGTWRAGPDLRLERVRQHHGRERATWRENAGLHAEWHGDELGNQNGLESRRPVSGRVREGLIQNYRRGAQHVDMECAGRYERQRWS